MTKTPDADDLRRRSRHRSLGFDWPEKQVAQQAMAAVCIARLAEPVSQLFCRGRNALRLPHHRTCAARSRPPPEMRARGQQARSRQSSGRIDPHDLLQELHMKATASKSDGMNRCLHVRYLHLHRSPSRRMRAPSLFSSWATRRQSSNIRLLR